MYIYIFVVINLSLIHIYTLSLSSFSSQFRTRHSGLLPSCTVSPFLPLTSDPLLSAAPPKPKNIVTDGTLGGFPIRVLEKIVSIFFVN